MVSLKEHQLSSFEEQVIALWQGGDFIQIRVMVRYNLQAAGGIQSGLFCILRNVLGVF